MVDNIQTPEEESSDEGVSKTRYTVRRILAITVLAGIIMAVLRRPMLYSIECIDPDFACAGAYLYLWLIGCESWYPFGAFPQPGEVPAAAVIPNLVVMLIGLLGPAILLGILFQNVWSFLIHWSKMPEPEIEEEPEHDWQI